MTGDAVRWTRSGSIKSSSEDCDTCERSEDTIGGEHTTTNLRICPGIKMNGKCFEESPKMLRISDRPASRGAKMPEHAPRSYPAQHLFFSCSQFVQIVLRLLSCCSQSTKTIRPSFARMSYSPALALKVIPRSKSGRSGLLEGVLALSLVYACSSSVSAQVVNDFSTSKETNSLSDASSFYDVFDDSGYNGGEDSVNGHFTPTWAVHIPDGDIDGKADQVAHDHGFINLGKIFDDHYHFHHNSVSKRSLDASHHHQKRLDDDTRVRWSRQQQIKSRKKRDFIRMRPSRTSSASRVELNDPKWPQMWYLNRGNGLDMNVIPAWEQGITGKGVVVTILDDGLESDHPDLEHNYDPKASYDVNSHDDDPMPHYDMTDSNRHGTRCAGEVAATANNSLCSVGIAFGARVGGVRMLDGDVTDAVEARSLSLNPQHIDIYSASWGPDDDGKTVDGPGELATRAFIEGVTKGRSGKGSIFIWASGNGGRELDNCNCDGYTNSIWTLSISSATEEGHVPWYSEKCSSTLATTYSSGAQNEKQVVTTDLHHSCTTSHTGTSASAPLAAGIVALVLEANRNLTWRDLQHIVVRTSKPGNLKDSTWLTNGVGRRVSHSFGYGLLDAAGMVNLARTWQMVPEQQRCEINAPHVEQMIPAKRYITLQLTVQHCRGVNFLEHVQAKISLTSQRRGDIVIYLQSPAGTRVTLLTSRVHDVSRSGFNEWPFMSVHTWGEAPHGNWLLEVHNEGRFLGYAVLKSWSLIFYGTAIAASKNDPVIVRPTDYIPSYSSPSLSIHHQPANILPNMNKYPVSVLTKPPAKNKANHQSSVTNGNGGGRKQQSQNHKVSPYGAVLTSPKNKGKNSKNNAQTNNAKPNAKGNSTNRPFGVQQSGKNNFYRVQTFTSSGKSSTGSVRQSSTTPRPKFGSQQFAFNSNSGTNRGLSSSSSSSYKPEKTRVHEKVAIKAPKQIKENNAYRPNTRISLSTDDPAPVTPSLTRYEPNPRIPKLFQQYDKIEQIFPEFHPYIGGSGGLSRDNMSPTKPVPNKKQYPSYANGGASLQEGNSSNNRGFGRSNNGSNGKSGGGVDSSRTSASSAIVVTNPKPSRENSKKFSSISSSSPSSSSPSTSLSSSQNFPTNDEHGKQSEGMYIPNRKNTKAQITQWDLVFFGTEQTPQPDDPIQIKPGPFGSYGGDIDSNFLVPETMGQWRDLQQVGENHVDVQRTTNDQTNTACTNFIADQRCIECMQGFFIYKERCWLRCPDQSYMVPEVPHNRNRNNHLNDAAPPENMVSVRSTQEGTTIVPDSPAPTRRAIMPPIPQKVCASCDITCLRCRGSQPSQCLQCHPGYHLTIVSSEESYCHPAMNGNNLSRATGRLSVEVEENDEDILKDLYAFWSIVLPGLVIIVAIVALSVIGRRLIKKWKSGRDHSYERVAFEVPKEEAQRQQQPILQKRETPSTSGRIMNQRILVESSSDSDN